MIIISNGHSRFVLTKVAAFCCEQKIKFSFISSLYPKSIHYKIFRNEYLFKLPIIRRFLNRAEKNLNDESNIFNIYTSEVFHQLAVYLYKKNNNSQLAIFLAYIAMFIYRIIAFFHIVFKKRGSTYYFRSGYGGISLLLAKAMKMKTVCDHSIANPLILDYLLNLRGSFPKNPLALKVNYYWRPVLFDLLNSDLIVCNSNFVRKSLLFTHPNLKIFVINWGLDNSFREALLKKKYRLSIRKSKKLSIVFMGSFEYRKGADDILKALSLINIPFTFQIIGNIDSGYQEKLPQNVTQYGYLEHSKAIDVLSKSDIFLFPSYAEGSARVISEAMACGCYVITTINSGSLIKNNYNGNIVRPNDPNQIAKLINNYSSNFYRIKKMREKAFEAFFYKKNTEYEFLKKIINKIQQ